MGGILLSAVIIALTVTEAEGGDQFGEVAQILAAHGRLCERVDAIFSNTFFGGTPENLMDFVRTLQEELVRAGVLPQDFDFDAHKQLVGMQMGDVPVTYADSSALERDFGFTPRIGVREGLRRFAQWYKAFYG